MKGLDSLGQNSLLRAYFCDFYRTTSSIIIGLFSVYPLIALYKAFGNIIGLG